MNPIELVNEKRLVELTRKLAEIPLETGNERR